jgi:hypothetical protein
MIELAIAILIIQAGFIGAGVRANVKIEHRLTAIETVLEMKK